MDTRNGWFGLLVLIGILIVAVVAVWFAKPYFAPRSPQPATAVTEAHKTPETSGTMTPTEGKKPEEVAKPQTVCPITGNPINKKLFVVVDGYRIYVCCPGCPDKIKADPKAAIEKIRARGEEPEKLPLTSHGESPVPKTFSDVPPIE